MAKRANREGHIRKIEVRGRTYWEARITVAYDSVTRKQKFKVFTAKTQAECKSKLDAFKAKRDIATPEKAGNVPLKQWLLQWYEDYVIQNVKTSTRASYEMIINQHLILHIGEIKLNDLKKTDIETMYRNLLKNGRVKKIGENKGLSVKTVRNIALCLHKALDEAFKNEYILRNVADLAEVPTLKSEDIRKKEIEILSKAEQQSLIMQCADSDDIYGIAIIFALFTGVRLGELLGIKWADIDFEKHTVKIQRQVNRLKDYSKNATAKTRLGIQNDTKSKTSTRVIALNEDLVAKLQLHKSWQEEQKKKWGKKYNDLDMTFAREDGYYIDPATFRDNYQKHLKRAGLTHYSIHAMRHTFASRALEIGLPIKAVSQILGHSQVQITMDLYQHLFPDVQMDMMNKIADYITS